VRSVNHFEASSLSTSSLLYVEPHDGGHRAEHLAFYLRVCHSLDVGLVAYAPQSVWAAAAALAGPAARVGRLAGVAAPRPLTFGAANAVLTEASRLALEAGVAAMFFPTLDAFVAPLAARGALGRGIGVPWGGVYFRDNFNYLAEEARSLPRWLKIRAKLALLRFALRRGAVELLTLNAAWRVAMPVAVTRLPEALSSLDRLAAQAAEAGWPLPRADDVPGRPTRFLLFGHMQPRKGVLELCRGFASLSDTELARVEMCLLGNFPASSYRRVVDAELDGLVRRGARIDRTWDHVSEAAIDGAYRRCDYLIAPYLRHCGSSGTVALAVQYGRPVLTQRAYQLGEEARAFELGLSVDPSDTPALAAALRRMLAGEIQVTDGMRQLRARRSPASAFEAARSALARMARVRAEPLARTRRPLERVAAGAACRTADKFLSPRQRGG
jgi:glycosyltransferase involved in cell wall biosynthesis